MKLSSINKYLTLALLLVFAIVFNGCSEKNAQIIEEVKTVKVTNSNKGTLELQSEYSSKLKPIEEIFVSPKMSGSIDSINAVVGQKIKQGEVLFTIDKKEAAAQLNQAQASLSSSNANLIRTKDSSYVEAINQYEAAIKQKQLIYDDAKNSFDKDKILYEQGAISKQDYETSENKYKSASIDLDAAKDTLKVFKEKSNPQSIEIAAAAVAQSESALEYSKIQLDNYTVTSPISGIISAKNVNKGELVSSAVNAYTIINTQTLVAEVNVSDAMMEKLRTGDKLQFKVKAVRDKLFEGTISNISPTIDAKTQFYIVKINIDNSEGILKPGMFAKIYLTSEKKDNVILVNNEAIIVENGVPFIYTVKDGVVKKKNVTVGLANDKLTEIISNLNEGEQVILEGQTFLNDGQKVNITS